MPAIRYSIWSSTDSASKKLICSSKVSTATTLTDLPLAWSATIFSTPLAGSKPIFCAGSSDRVIAASHGLNRSKLAGAMPNEAIAASYFARCASSNRSRSATPSVAIARDITYCCIVAGSGSTISITSSSDASNASATASSNQTRSGLSKWIVPNR